MSFLLLTLKDTDRLLLLAEDRHGHRGHQQETLSLGGEELTHTHTHGYFIIIIILQIHTFKYK